VFLVAVAGFLLLGPDPYLAGTTSINLGGMRGSATAAGIIDNVGYLSGWLSGDTVAGVTV
jgi:OPA family glycerol-3-phosphate transporter-like MFS transporter